MVGFESVIPFFLIGVVAVAIVMAFLAAGKFISLYRAMRNSLSGRASNSEVAQEQSVEGGFYWLAEIFRITQFAIVLLVLATILRFLIDPSPDFVTIFDDTLGTWAVPLVIFIVAYWAVKSLPWILHHAKVSAETED